MSTSFAIGQSKIVVMIAIAPLYIAASPAFAKPAEREALEIPCPRTMVAPDVQQRIDAGEKPVVIMSRYRPGLVNPQGFCTITQSSDGKQLRQVYNEATSVGQVPVRFEYRPFELAGYAGPKGLPFGSGTSDMLCFVPHKGESAVDCRISLTPDNVMSLRRYEGRGAETGSAVQINPKNMFGVNLRQMARHAHYELSFDFQNAMADGKYWLPLPADCTQQQWRNVATTVTVSAVRRNGSSLELLSADKMEGRENTGVASALEKGAALPVIAKFSVNEQEGANVLISRILSNEAIRIDVKTACEGTLSKAYLTELPRVMNHVFKAIRPAMLRQR